MRVGLTGKPVTKPFGDAKEHFISNKSDVPEAINDLCEEIATLREALLRTYAVSEGMKDECRRMREVAVEYANETGDRTLLKAIPAIPEDDLFVESVVFRASIIDSGRTCDDSCETPYCLGSPCPLFSVRE